MPSPQPSPPGEGEAIGAVYIIFNFFLPEWRAQSKTKEYAKSGRKLKERLAMLVEWFRDTHGEEYAPDIHLHPFYIIIATKTLLSSP